MMKKQILAESGKEIDSTSNRKYSNTEEVEKIYYKEGKILRIEYQRSDGSVSAVKFFENNGNFELRREICGNGTIAFEGILHKDKFYGPSTWWHCNGVLRQKGLRFADKATGGWNEYHEDGKFKEFLIYNNSLTDSLEKFYKKWY